jgi:ribosome-associated toxin RatA of RatAB toxin-antitoxin module
MAEVNQSVLVPYSAAQMFELVDAVERYPEFLPWCAASELIDRNDAELRAALHVNFRGIKQKFSTRNARSAPHAMGIQLVEGPFKALEGSWKFIPLSDAGCKVEFRLSWEFSSRLLASLAGPVFNHIALTMVDAFVKRAESLYG